MRSLVKTAIVLGGVPLLLAGLVVWQLRGLPSVTGIRNRLRAGSAPQEHSAWVPLSAISPKLQAAVLVSEDVAFYRHRGFNFAEVRKSFLENVQAGRYRRGASTITQQVAKNLFLGPEKTLRRKFKEAILTWRLERAFSKSEILEIYLNSVPWGDAVAGAEAASQFYFEKSARDLAWAEAALLAGILPNPQRLDPFQAAEEALRRREIVLLKLLAHGDVSQEEFARAVSSPCVRKEHRVPTGSTTRPVELLAQWSALAREKWPARPTPLHRQQGCTSPPPARFSGSRDS